MSGRREFLDERRRVCEERFDTLHSADYDARWGTVDALHLDFVLGLAGRLIDNASILDAACGTGKYWPFLLEAGVRLVGVDQSRGMLEQAKAKFPDVPVMKCPLQELGDLLVLRDRFDGLMCVDALECVGPEDWPVVLGGFYQLLRHGGLAYLTVELLDEHAVAGRHAVAPPASDAPLVDGERFLDDDGYHYYPTALKVDGWLGEAGFEILAEAEGDGYRHLLVAR